MKRRWLVPFATLALVSAAQVHADLQQVLGRRFVVKANPDATRRVLAIGSESSTDVALVGDPTVSGGRLRVVVHGASPSEATFLLLPASRWTRTAAGFVYRDAGIEGVRRVLLRRSPNGSALLKVMIVAPPGSLFDLVQPPNPGDDVSVLVTIEGGDTYCWALGGPSGGIEGADTATRWVIRDATAEAGCATVTPTSTTTTSSLGVPPCGTQVASCDSWCPNAPLCDGWCPAGSFCDSEYDPGSGLETCVCKAGGPPCADVSELTCRGACPPGLGCITNFSAPFPCSCR